jgi:membrane protease YdiL (CAAX protease family)
MKSNGKISLGFLFLIFYLAQYFIDTNFRNSFWLLCAYVVLWFSFVFLGFWKHLDLLKIDILRLIKKINRDEVLIIFGLLFFLIFIWFLIIFVLFDFDFWAKRREIAFFINGNIPMVLIIAPLFEEVFFRYVVFKRLEGEVQTGTIVIVSAFLFSFAHAGILIIVFSFFIGVASGILYLKSKNILLCVILHFLINLFIVLFWNLANLI